MAHSCPDGRYTRLTRTGPVGTTAGVTFTCPRCGWQHEDYEIEKLPGKPRPDPWQKKPSHMRRSIARLRGMK